MAACVVELVPAAPVAPTATLLMPLGVYMCRNASVFLR